jgi:hypothetical protein
MMITAACSTRKGIPDGDLVKIFHDAFIANAYCNEKLSGEDSLLIYEPILARYGYTIDDMRYTVQTISQRKSSRLSDLVGEASQILENESRGNSYQLLVLDTIDNVAKRRYTRTIYEDSLIRAKRLRDTSKLRITIDDLTAGEYTISFDYFIDTLDENRSSRVLVCAMVNDTIETLRHTMMLSRFRDGSYTRKLLIDSTHTEIRIDMYYHHRNEEPKVPDMKITNFKVVRVLPTEQSVDSLYRHQLDIRLLNYDMMMGFTADTVKVVERDSIEVDNEKDSIALRTH